MPDAVISVDNLQVIVDNFHAAHRADYGHSFESTPIEVITLRVFGYVPSDRLSWPDRTNSGGDVADALLYTRPTTFDNGQTLDTPRYERARLSAGQTIAGPAIIVQHNSTSLIPPGYDASVKASDNIHILEKRV